MRWVWLVALGACFNPQFPVGIPCSEANTCPPGQTCDLAMGLCLPGADAGPDAAPEPTGGTPLGREGTSAREGNVDLALAPNGDAFLVFDDASDGTVWARRLVRATGVWDPLMQLTPSGQGPKVAVDGRGRAL